MKYFNYLTQEEVDNLRVIILTPRRDQTLIGMRYLFRGTKDGCTFNPLSLVDQICKSYDHFLTFEAELSSWPEKFDNLLFFTIVFRHQDRKPWAKDNFCRPRLRKVIKELGNTWKGYMQFSNAELGILSLPGQLLNASWTIQKKG